MNTLAQFNYNSHAVRVSTIDGQPWFCLTDVCDVLGIKRQQHFLKSSQCDQDGVRQAEVIDSLGRSQEAVFISEPNLYALVIRSDKPEARPFQRWLTHEVLPEIRKTGRYNGAPLGISADPIEALLQAATASHRANMVLAQRVDNVVDRLEHIESRIEAATEALTALPVPSVEIPEATTREKINEAYRLLASATMTKDFHGLWTRIYLRFETRFHKRLSSHVQGGESKLDAIERLGMLDQLLAIIHEIRDNVRAAS